MDQKEQLRKFVETWKAAGPELEKIRRRDMDSISLTDFIESMDMCFKMALRDFPAAKTSGLIELEAWLAKSKS